MEERLYAKLKATIEKVISDGGDPFSALLSALYCRVHAQYYDVRLDRDVHKAMIFAASSEVVTDDFPEKFKNLVSDASVSVSSEELLKSYRDLGLVEIVAKLQKSPKQDFASVISSLVSFEDDSKIFLNLKDCLKDIVSKERIALRFELAVEEGKAEPEERVNFLSALLEEVSQYDRGVREGMSGKKQQDATEFLVPLFEALYGESPLVGKSRSNPENSEKYSESTTAFDSRTISLEIGSSPDKKTSDLLRLHCAEWDIKELDFLVSASGEKEVARGKQQLSYKVVDPSKDLMVKFNRFADSKDGDAKKKSDEIELDNISLPILDFEDSQEYEATAFIVCSGEKISSGHYDSYILEDDRKWYCYNDDKRSEVSKENLQKAKAQAYAVKYSPTDKSKLPSRQFGTINTGNSRYLNAAFAFALSFTSLHKQNDAVLDLKPISDEEKVLLGLDHRPIALASVLEAEEAEVVDGDQALGLRKLPLDREAKKESNEEERRKRKETISKQLEEILGQVKDFSSRDYSPAFQARAMRESFVEKARATTTQEQIKQEITSICVLYRDSEIANKGYRDELLKCFSALVGNLPEQFQTQDIFSKLVSDVENLVPYSGLDLEPKEKRIIETLRANIYQALFQSFPKEYVGEGLDAFEDYDPNSDYLEKVIASIESMKFIPREKTAEELKAESKVEEGDEEKEEEISVELKHYRSLCLKNVLDIRYPKGGSRKLSAADLKKVTGFITKHHLTSDEVAELLGSCEINLFDSEVKAELINLYKTNLIDDLKGINWYDEKETDKIVKPVDYADWEAGKIEIKTCGEEAITEGFRNLTPSSEGDIASLMSALAAKKKEIYDRELRKKVLYCLYEVVREQYEYTVSEIHLTKGYNETSSSSKAEAVKAFPTLLVELKQLIEKEEGGAEEAKELLEKFPFLQSVKLLDANGGSKLYAALRSVSNGVIYNGGRTINRARVGCKCELKDFFESLDFLAMEAAKSEEDIYYTSVYQMRSGCPEFKADQGDDHNKTALKRGIYYVNNQIANLYGTEVAEIEFKFEGEATKSHSLVSYKDSTGVPKIKAIFYVRKNINEEEERIINAFVTNHKELFAKACSTPKYQNLAAALVDLSEKGISVNSLGDGYQQLFQREYLKAVEGGIRNVVMADVIDPVGLPAILGAIYHKRIHLNKLEVSFRPGSVFSEELQKFCRDHEDELPPEHAFVKELVINGDEFGDENNLIEVANLFARIGVKKLTIISRDSKIANLEQHQKRIADLLSLIAQNGLDIELDYPFYYHDCQAQKDESKDVAREVRSRAILEIKDEGSVLGEKDVGPRVEKKAGKGVKIFSETSVAKDFKGHGHSRLVSAKNGVAIEQTQALAQEQQQEQEQEQEEEMDQNNQFNEDRLIRRGNIYQKSLGKDRKLKFPQELGRRTEGELKEVWDKITGNEEEEFDDSKVRFADPKAKITAMTVDAAEMLYGNWSDGVFSPGLNLLYLPEGFYLFKKGEETILDFNITRKSARSPHPRLTFDRVREYDYHDNFLPNYLELGLPDMKQYLLKLDGVKEAEVDAIVAKYEKLFSGEEKEKYRIPFLKCLYHGEMKSLESFLKICERTKSTIGEENFEKFQKCFLDSVANNPKSGFNFFTEAKHLELLNSLCEMDKQELNFFFHLAGENNKKAANLDGLYLIKPFHDFRAQLRSLGIESANIPKAFNLQGDGDMRVLLFRMTKILSHKACTGKHQEIFQQICSGKISLAEKGAYHALCVDGFEHLDVSMNLSLQKMSKDPGVRSYAVSLIELKKSLDGESYEDLCAKFLRHIATPVKDDAEKKIRLEEYVNKSGSGVDALKQAKHFLGDLNDMSLSEADKKKMLSLFINYPPEQNYEAGDAHLLYTAISDNLDGFVQAFKAISVSKPSFQDLSCVAFASERLDLNEFTQNLAKISNHSWKFYVRIFQNIVARRSLSPLDFNTSFSCVEGLYGTGELELFPQTFALLSLTEEFTPSEVEKFKSAVSKLSPAELDSLCQIKLTENSEVPTLEYLSRFIGEYRGKSTEQKKIALETFVAEISAELRPLSEKSSDYYTAKRLFRDYDEKFKTASLDEGQRKIFSDLASTQKTKIRKKTADAVKVKSPGFYVKKSRYDWDWEFVPEGTTYEGLIKLFSVGEGQHIEFALPLGIIITVTEETFDDKISEVMMESNKNYYRGGGVNVRVVETTSLGFYLPVSTALESANLPGNDAVKEKMPDFCLELLFMKIVAGEKEMDLKEVRRLRGIEKGLSKLVKEKFAIAEFDEFSLHKEKIISLFETVAILSDKFPKDLEVILTALCSNDSLSPENIDLSLKRLKIFADSCNRDFPLDFFYYCLKNASLDIGLIKKVVDNPFLQEQTKEKYVQFQPEVVKSVGIDEIGTALQALYDKCKKDNKYDLDPELLDRVYGKANYFIEQVVYDDSIGDHLTKPARDYCRHIARILQAVDGYVEDLSLERDPVKKFKIKQNIDNLVKIIDAGLALENPQDHRDYIGFLDYAVGKLIFANRPGATKACADWENHQHLALNFLENSKISNVAEFKRFCDLVLDKEQGGATELKELYVHTHVHFDKLASYFSGGNRDYAVFSNEVVALSTRKYLRTEQSQKSANLNVRRLALEQLSKDSEKLLEKMRSFSQEVKDEELDEQLTSFVKELELDTDKRTNFGLIPESQSISEAIQAIKALARKYNLREVQMKPGFKKAQLKTCLKNLETKLAETPLPDCHSLDEQIEKSDWMLDSFVRMVSESEEKLAEVGGNFNGYVEKLKALTDRDPTSTRDVDKHVQFDDSSLFLADRISQLIGESEHNAARRDQIKHSFEMINCEGKAFALLGKEEIQEKIEKCSKALVGKGLSTEEKYGAQIQLLALLRESMFRVDHKFAYSTQFLPILYLMHTDEQESKKLMAEIATGQGKSLITALYSSFQALSGNAVHITSSTDALSIRDYVENKHFYEYIGLKSYYVDNSGISEGGKYEKTAIYHSSQSNLYFFCAKMHLEGREGVVEIDDRVLIADEADTMLDNKTTWRLAVGDERENRLKDLYKIVNQFYQDKKESIDGLKQTRDAATQTAEANKIANEFLFLLKRDNLDLHKSLHEAVGQDEELLIDKVKSLLASAQYSATLVEGKDYMVEAIETKIREDGKERIAKVNVARIIKSSGEPDRYSQWGDGVQQLMHSRLEKEGKGKFSCEVENLSLTAGTGRQLIKYFGHFVGITGTMGVKADLDLLRETFGVENAVNIPTHNISQRKDLDGIIAENSDKQLELLSAICRGTHTNAEQNRESNQPMLVICETMLEADLLYEKMKQGTVQIISGRETTAELERKLEKASAEGMITISTPFSGRGTDIKTKHPQGLYTVLLSVFPDRTTGQVKGRSGRNGHPGKTISIIDGHCKKYHVGLSKVGEKPPELQISAIRESLYAQDRESTKLQVAESELAESLFLEFCHYKRAIVSNNDEYASDEVSTLSSDLDKRFANFISSKFAYYKNQYELEEVFKIEEFKAKVEEPLLAEWKSFAEASLLKELKIKIADEHEEGSEEHKQASSALSQRIKSQVTANVRAYSDVLSAQQEGIQSFYERAEVTADYALRRKAFYHYHRRTYGDGGDGEDKPLRNVYIPTGELDIQVYTQLSLGKNGKYKPIEQHMLHMADVLDNGFKIKEQHDDKSDKDGVVSLQELLTPTQIGFYVERGGERELKLKLKTALTTLLKKGDEEKEVAEIENEEDLTIDQFVAAFLQKNPIDEIKFGRKQQVKKEKKVDFLSGEGGRKKEERLKALFPTDSENVKRALAQLSELDAKLFERITIETGEDGSIIVTGLGEKELDKTDEEDLKSSSQEEIIRRFFAGGAKAKLTDIVEIEYLDGKCVLRAKESLNNFEGAQKAKEIQEILAKACTENVNSSDLIFFEQKSEFKYNTPEGVPIDLYVLNFKDLPSFKKFTKDCPENKSIDLKYFLEEAATKQIAQKSDWVFARNKNHENVILFYPQESLENARKQIAEIKKQIKEGEEFRIILPLLSGEVFCVDWEVFSSGDTIDEEENAEWKIFQGKMAALEESKDKSQHEFLTQEQLSSLFIHEVLSGRIYGVADEKKKKAPSEDKFFAGFRDKVICEDNARLARALTYHVESDGGLFDESSTELVVFQEKFKSLQKENSELFTISPKTQEIISAITAPMPYCKHDRIDDFSLPNLPELKAMLQTFAKENKIEIEDVIDKERIIFTLRGDSSKQKFLNRLQEYDQEKKLEVSNLVLEIQGHNCFDHIFGKEVLDYKIDEEGNVSRVSDGKRIEFPITAIALLKMRDELNEILKELGEIFDPLPKEGEELSVDCNPEEFGGINGYSLLMANGKFKLQSKFSDKGNEDVTGCKELLETLKELKRKVQQKELEEKDLKIISDAFSRRDGIKENFHLSKKDFSDLKKDFSDLAPNTRPKVTAKMIEKILEKCAEGPKESNRSLLYYADFGSLEFDFTGLNTEKTQKFFGSCFFANFRNCQFINLDLTNITPEVKKSIDSMIFPKCVFRDAQLPEDFKFKWSIDAISGVSEAIREAKPSNVPKFKGVEGVGRSIERLRHLPSTTVALTSAARLSSSLAKGR